MAGSVAGSMIGNSLSSGGGLFGGSSEPAAAPAAPTAAAAPVQPAWTQSPQPSGTQQQVCAFEHRNFMQCMSNTGDNLDECRSLYDAYKSCGQQVQQ